MRKYFSLMCAIDNCMNKITVKILLKSLEMVSLILNNLYKQFATQAQGTHGGII